MADRRPPLVVVRIVQALIVLATVLHIFAVNYVADDGFISFRYAQHFAEGSGIVYNVGERVEGYTNFLWVVVLAAAKWIHPSVELLQVARIAGSLVTVLSVVLAFQLSALLRLGPMVGLLAGALVGANSSVVAWAPAGLETSLFALLVFGAATSYVSYLQSSHENPRRRGTGTIVLAGVLLGLAAMTRPDGVFFFALTLAALVMAERPQSPGATDVRRTIGALAPFIVAFAAIYLPYFVWRYSYYGDLFPNTAYAKVGFGISQLGRGARYVLNYVVNYGVFIWALPVALYLWRSRAPWLWYFAWLVAPYTAYVVYVGGDGLAFHRFIAHIAPLVSFVAAAALVDFHRRYIVPNVSQGVGVTLATISIAVILAVTAKTTLLPVFWADRPQWFFWGAPVRWVEPQAVMQFPGNGRMHSYVWFDNYFVDRLAAAARYLEQNAPEGSVVASTPAGAIAYYMHHQVIDMLGLNDRHIARVQDTQETNRRYGRAGHEKGDGGYVLSRSPDYILMGNVAVFPVPLSEEVMGRKLVLRSEHELWENPEFHRRYELVTVRLSNDGLFQYFSFYRKKAI